MNNFDSAAAQSLAEALAEVVARIEELANTFEVGVQLLTDSIRSDAMTELTELLAHYTQLSLISVQRYAELQAQWMLSGA